MYEVIYLPTARKQLEDIVDYLAFELNAPDAALDFIDEVDTAAKSLAEMPYRHPIYHTSFAVLEEVRWIGDGKIFVTDVANVVRVRTGEEGYDALQSDE